MLMKREARYVIKKDGKYWLDCIYYYQGKDEFFDKQMKIYNKYPEEKGYSVELVSDKRYDF